MTVNQEQRSVEPDEVLKAYEDLQFTISGVPILIHERGGASLLSFFAQKKGKMARQLPAFTQVFVIQLRLALSIPISEDLNDLQMPVRPDA